MDLFGGLTDVALAVVGCGLGLTLLQRGGASAGTGGVGLLLVGLAAGFGAVRLTVAPDLAVAHDGLSRMAAMVGEPMLGVGYATAVLAPQHGKQARSITFVVTLVASVLLVGVPLWRTVAAGSGMVAAALGGLGSRRVDVAALAVGGAVLTVVAGLVIGTEGLLLGASRIGWFHIALALSHVMLGVGLLRLDPADAP